MMVSLLQMHKSSNVRPKQTVIHMFIIITYLVILFVPIMVVLLVDRHVKSVSKMSKAILFVTQT